ncbi:hypothetical protein BST97_01785 [Nonlabens spongiae]|uniref:ABC transporter permease n=1 Tax=Nonlabens spongiae TaxID=331648 RepID=A0A1W6MH81_9FLAO|nr:hypothetical protein BST97_01785 [Nonlabens spongiae]
MSEILLIIRDLLRIDILVGFGFYSIIYFLIKLFLRNKKWLADFDKSAIQTVIYVGIAWFVLWLIGLISYYFELDNNLLRREYYDQLTNKYTFAVWAEPLL